MLISVDDVKIKYRVRHGDLNLEPLMESMNRYGLLHPIAVDSRNVLIAGYRRLEAARRLGWKTICATMHESVDAARALELSLEENERRLPVSPEDLRDARARLERLRNPNPLARAWLAAKDFIARIFGPRKD